MNKFLHKIISLSELSYLLLPCLSGLILAFILRTVLFRPNNYEIPLLLHRELPIISVFITLAGVVLLFSLIASIHLFQNLAKLYADEKERAVLQKQMQQLQEQIQDADSIYTEIKGMKHDMKSHLSNIRMLVKSDVDENKEAEIEEYLGKLEETVSSFDFVYQTGNSVCDIIIHQKFMESKSNATDFSANFIYPVRLNIDVYDLAVILNNGLENAIEACNKKAENGRYINLLAYAKGEMFFIEIENSFATENILIDSDTGLPQSSKQENGLHGMGLSNIRRCARKYLGDIDYQISHSESGNIFRLTVMLQSKN
jgi:sensor histidine kinase YesM